MSYIPRLSQSLNIDSFAKKTKSLKSSNFCNYTLFSVPMLYFLILFKKYTHGGGAGGGSAARHLKCQAIKTMLFLPFLGFILPLIPPCSNITKKFT